jgi:hypothetical protein
MIEQRPCIAEIGADGVPGSALSAMRCQPNASLVASPEELPHPMARVRR